MKRISTRRIVSNLKWVNNSKCIWNTNKAPFYVSSNISFASFNNRYNSTTNKILTAENMNQAVLKTAYAVRGELVIRAEKLQKRLQDPSVDLPFKEIVFCNIGNPQELGQKPITFYRQVLSLLEYPELMKKSDVFPKDAIERADLLLKNIPGGTGAYSNSQGLPIVRKHVAEFITERDGYPADPEDIYLTDGASAGVSRILNCMIRGKEDGIMIPIPQYPLYSATIPLFGGSQVNYYLDEENGWGLKVAELEKEYENAKNKGIVPRALVIINPGNPTGQCLDYENMKEIIDFCHRKRLILLADEVYQVNSYIKKWTSFKKVVKDMGAKYSEFELISFHSVSKGVIGECGKRGGYMETIGIDSRVREEIYKLASISLCCNVPGQVVVDLMVKPPKKGDPSYELYHKETTEQYESLKRRALTLSAALNKMEGVTCNAAEGAMYLFPNITLPPGAVQDAAKKGKAPDVNYCIELLENTGLCVVPGSGFGQKDGSFHFRTTFLPSETKINEVIKRMHAFHDKFLKQFK